MNRHAFHRPEATIDPTDEFIHASSQILILLHILSGRNRQLDQHNFADPLGVLGKESLERLEFLRDTLDIVQTVNTDDDLDAIKPRFQRTEAFDNGFFLKTFDELVRVDTNGVGADLAISPVKFNTVRLSLETEDTGAGREEVSSIVICVESIQKDDQLKGRREKKRDLEETYPIRSH